MFLIVAYLLQTKVYQKYGTWSSGLDYISMNLQYLLVLLVP